MIGRPRAGRAARAERNRQLAALWAEGLTSAVIAARLGLAAPLVRVTARQLGLPKRRSGIRRPKSPARRAEDARLAEWWAAGLPAAAIAERLGREPKTVLNRARALGLPKRRAHRPAGPTPWAKRTAAGIRQAVAEIGRRAWRASSVVWPRSGQRAEGPSPTSARIADWLEGHGCRTAKGEPFTANSVSATIWRLAPLGLLEPELRRRVAAANKAAKVAAQTGKPKDGGGGAVQPAPRTWPAAGKKALRFADVDARTLAIERLAERRVRRDPADLLTHSPCGSAAALCAGNW